MNPSASAQGAARRLPLRRRLLFLAIIGIGIYGVTELGAVVALRVQEGCWFSPGRLRLLQERCVADNSPVFTATEQQRPFVIHPYVGYVLNPGRQTLPSGNRTDPRYPVSPYGFSDDLKQLPQRDGDHVIVGILGGSVARNFSFDCCDLLAAELGKLPAFAHKKFVFVRMAMSAYKQPQQLMTLNYFLALGAQFDIVLNIDGFNEVAVPVCHNVPSGECPLYPQDWHLMVKDLPDPAAQRHLALTELLQAQRRTLASTMLAAPLHYSPVCNLAWKVIDRELERRYANEIDELQRYQPSDRDDGAMGPVCSFADDEAMYDNLAENWKRCSCLLDGVCRSNGIRYFHFLQPNQYVPGSKPMNAAERAVAYRDTLAYKACVEAGYPRLLRKGRELAQKGVHFCDLTGIFAQQTKPIYTDTCCHVNEAGNQILARAIAQAVALTPEPPLVSSGE